MNELRQAVERMRAAAGLPPLVDPAFGLRLREMRKERGLSLRKLAAEAEISPTFISKVENGHVSPPSHDAICRVAKALGRDHFELLLLAGKLPKEVEEMLLLSSASDLRRLYYDILRGQA